MCSAHSSRIILATVLSGTLLLSAHGCGIFEPRTPQDPTQPSLDFQPPTDPLTVISNFQSAIAQKSVPNYVQCLSDPATAPRAFSFIPSSEGTAVYASLFRNWTIAEEQAYFQNLSNRTTPTSVSSLVLTQKNMSLSPDSAVLEYDYVLTFEHTVAGFPTRASGDAQFVLLRSTSNIWTICRWSDFKTTSDVSWSLFKGKFSN